MRDLHYGPEFIRIGHSAAASLTDAVDEACASLGSAVFSFILAFIPNGFNPDEAVRALTKALPEAPVFGCTTAGEITTNGYESGALLLMAFPRENFRCSALLLDALRPLNSTEIAAKAQRQNHDFTHQPGWNRLGLLLTDGLSKQEDLLISTLESVLDGLPVYGGSSGDGLLFEETCILSGGAARRGAALLLLIETRMPFQGIGFDHFLPAGEPLVITSADPDERIVYEINGAPAAEEYARLTGCAVKTLSPRIFAENPILLRHRLNYYVRAIREVTEDGALSFLAAIDDGLIMTPGRGKEIIETLKAGLDVQDAAGRRPDFILGFDCVLRRLEIEQKKLSDEVSRILQERRVSGFNTYGEQQSGVHMNQTFVGIAFFEPGS